MRPSARGAARPSTPASRAAGAVVAGLQWSTQDLSAFTLTDSLTLLDSATWGTSSDLVIGTGTQGEMDAGRDGVVLVSTLVPSIVWAQYLGLLVRVTATSFGGVGCGTQANVRLGVVSTTNPATMAGILAGIQVQSGGNRFTAASSVGAGPIVNSVNMGALTVFDAFIPFNLAGPIGAAVSGVGPSGSDARASASPQTVTDLILALVFGVSGVPTSTITHTAIVVETALVDAP